MEFTFFCAIMNKILKGVFMDKTRKSLSIITIISTAIVSLLLIMWLFGFDLLGDFKLNIYITLGSIAVGGFFAINSLNMIMKNKALGWVSFALITGAVFLIILSAWLNLQNVILIEITWSLGLISVVFNIIVSSGLDLGKSHRVLQIIVYLIVGITDFVTTLGIFGIINLLLILAYFVTLIILSLVGIIILKVLAKRKVANSIVEEKNMVKITKEEYSFLIEKAKKYDELMSNQENSNQ